MFSVIFPGSSCSLVCVCGGGGGGGREFAILQKEEFSSFLIFGLDQGESLN